jgi:hypothetical protein
LLPLGSHERWHCSQCGQDPHARYKSSPVIIMAGKIVGTLFFAFMCLGAWMAEPDPETRNFIWGMRIVAPLSFIGLFYLTIRRPRAQDSVPPRIVTPLPSDTCIYCSGRLIAQPHLHFPSCQIRIFT